MKKCPRDLKKCEIEIVWGEYDITRKTLPGSCCSCTIDRERDIYLTLVGIGREEYSNRMTYILFWKKASIEVVLDKFGNDSSVRIGDDKPITTTWDLVSIHLPLKC